MTGYITARVAGIFSRYNGKPFPDICRALRELWCEFEPKSTAGIVSTTDQKQETLGIPVKILREIGQEMGKITRENPARYLLLMEMLWNEYGREGRIAASVSLGKMELAHPELILPALRRLCRTCVTWEDADQLAMRAVEPIVRKDPERWLPGMKNWIMDSNKWVQRTGATVTGRLAMVRGEYTADCLAMLEPLLPAEDRDVRRAVSFAVRLCARGDIQAVHQFLESHLPPTNPACAWVLCDVIRSMTPKFLPILTALLPRYQAWERVASGDASSLRSIQSAIQYLQKAQAASR